MTDYSITNLLQQVKAINSKYDSLAKLTGENFNVFSIMRIERNEVFTHSAFIAELLNPNGCHEQGSIFLKIFTTYLNDIIENNNLPEFDFLHTRVSVEKYIGFINNDSTEGGRIDVNIEDTFNLLMIENKVDAGDQKNQLLRYYNYGKGIKKNFRLIYLTLEEKEINDVTTGANNEVKQKTISITYGKHIIEWLEICKKETVNLPILRETITQYIHLLKRLTAQTTNHKMSKELINLITNSVDNFNSAKSISKEFENAKSEIYLKFWNPLAKRICDVLGTDWEFDLLDKWGIFFYYKKCKLVGFGFDRLQFDELFFGVMKNRSKNILAKDIYKEKIKKLANEMLLDDINSDWWICRQYIAPFNIYDNNHLEVILSTENQQQLWEDVIEKFRIFREDHPKYTEYIIEISNQLNDILSKLKDVERIIKIEFQSSSMGIWEDCVLFMYFQTNTSQTIAFDIMLQDDQWIIEVFIKNNIDKKFIDSILIDLPLFKNDSYNNYSRTSRNGIIYKKFEYESTIELANTLISMAKVMMNIV